MVKKLSKVILKKLFSFLPLGARKLLFDSLLEEKGLLGLLSEVESSHNIEHVGINGSYGCIIGSPNDHAVFHKYARDGRWADRTNALLLEYFSKYDEGCYIDIGANIGLTTIPLAQNGLISCYCFEPDPTNYKFLRLNMFANCENNNVTIFNLAIYNKKSNILFEKSPINYGDHRIRIESKRSELGENTWNTIKVNAVSLDSMELAIKTPLVVKIDTQGAEPYVIEGGRNLLSQASIVIFEFSPYMMSRMGSDPNYLYDFVSDYEKVCIALGEYDDRYSPVPGEEAVKLLKKFNEDNVDKPFGSYCDVICYK